MRTEWLLKIKEEVTKQLKARFIKPVRQAEWIANIVLVPKNVCGFQGFKQICP